MKKSNVRSGRKDADSELVEQHRKTTSGFFPGSTTVSPGFVHTSRACYRDSARLACPALGDGWTCLCFPSGTLVHAAAVWVSSGYRVPRLVLCRNRPSHALGMLKAALSPLQGSSTPSCSPPNFAGSSTVPLGFRQAR